MGVFPRNLKYVFPHQGLAGGEFHDIHRWDTQTTSSMLKEHIQTAWSPEHFG